jgi:uncharacterized protein (DUF433 family)
VAHNDIHPYVEKRMGAGGESTFVKGTRVRVHDIARLFQIVQEELVVERMLEALPHLTREQIDDALSYWLSHADEIAEEMREEEQVMSKIPPAW